MPTEKKNYVKTYVLHAFEVLCNLLEKKYLFFAVINLWFGMYKMKKIDHKNLNL